MDKIISSIIIILVAWVILALLVPFLHGVFATIATVVVVVGAILGLMKIVGIWF